MKRTALIFAAALVVFGLAGCNKNNPDDLAAKIVGQWELAGAEFPTKSVTVGDEVLTVYVDFQAGGVFTLYQQLGLVAGRRPAERKVFRQQRLGFGLPGQRRRRRPHDDRLARRHRRLPLPAQHHSAVVCSCGRFCNLLLSLHALRQLSCSRLYVSEDLQSAEMM